ncbi:probable G-protein coupled receptor 139 [Stegostoma tigrinum]|uniref:probable G-protein coupled receptor 139 n=1 Tax=Stegostoma tigrinum TaxID=3053191 RepID=UPI00286FFDC7|nr:probable G-protein coupled receptor 139 [Stegostoma tigrinum]
METIDEGRAVDSVYLDFSKAFDKVLYGRLMSNVESHGIQVHFLATGVLARGKCGVSHCTTRYLVIMAAADLMQRVPAQGRASLLLRKRARLRQEAFHGSIRGTWPECDTLKMYSQIDQIQKIYYMVLAVVSVPANLLGIVILSCRQCGLSNCTTRYLVAMATADLLVILTEVLLRQISYYYFHMTFLDITPVCSVRAVLLSAATDCSVWFTVSFSFDRFVSICCQKLKTMYCTERTTTVVLATTCTLLCLRNIPFYFIFDPWVIIDNVLWLCVVKPSVYNDPAWVGFSWLDAVLTPLLPFALILLLNALTVRHILVTSQARKRLRGESKGENPRDPEMENRRKSVILLFAISGSFILLWSVSVIEFLYYHISGADPRHYTQPEVIFRQIGVMLVNLSCCTNTFIYGVTQSKFREQVKSLMEYPVTAIIQFMNKRA